MAYNEPNQIMINIITSLISLAILIYSSELFINQAIALAKKFNISNFLIGFTLVTLGTSLPDIVIGIYSSITNHTDLAISTVLGSAFVNITLLLGVLAFFTKYKLLTVDIKKNIPITLGGIIIFSILVITSKNFQMTWISGIVTISLFIASTIIANKINKTTVTKSTKSFNILILIASLIIVLISGKLCVDNLLEFASSYKIENSLLGFFLFGTIISIPELIASIMAVKKGSLELSLGNILGATLINILLITGVSSLIRTLDFTPYLVEVLFILLSAIFFWIFAILGKKYYISKKEGSLLLLLYITFIIFKYIGF